MKTASEIAAEMAATEIMVQLRQPQIDMVRSIEDRNRVVRAYMSRLPADERRSIRNDATDELDQDLLDSAIGDDAEYGRIRLQAEYGQIKHILEQLEPAARAQIDREDMLNHADHQLEMRRYA